MPEDSFLNMGKASLDTVRIGTEDDLADLHFASRLPHSITLSFVLASPFFMSLFIIRRYSRAFDLYLSIKKSHSDYCILFRSPLCHSYPPLSYCIPSPLHPPRHAFNTHPFRRPFAPLPSPTTVRESAQKSKTQNLSELSGAL